MNVEGLWFVDVDENFAKYIFFYVNKYLYKESRNLKKKKMIYQDRQIVFCSTLIWEFGKGQRSWDLYNSNLDQSKDSQTPIFIFPAEIQVIESRL